MSSWNFAILIASSAALIASACGPESSACGADTDCKGDRICSGGACVSPDGANSSTGDNSNPNSSTGNNGTPNSSTTQNNTNPNSTTTATVNGMPADEFYAQFHWEETTTYVDGAAAFEEQGDGTNAFLTHVFLYDDGTANVFYEEGEGEVTLTGHSLSTSTDTQTRIDTTWQVDGVTLRIGDVFACNGSTFNDEDQLACTLQRSIITAAAVDETARLTPGFGDASPDDTEFADYSSE